MFLHGELKGVEKIMSNYSFYYEIGDDSLKMEKCVLKCGQTDNHVKQSRYGNAQMLL